MTQNAGFVAQGTPQGAAVAPPIIMPHEYRGSCTNCHQLGTPAGAQNIQSRMQNSQTQNNVMQDPNTAHVVIGGGN